MLSVAADYFFNGSTAFMPAPRWSTNSLQHMGYTENGIKMIGETFCDIGTPEKQKNSEQVDTPQKKSRPSVKVGNILFDETKWEVCLLIARLQRWGVPKMCSSTLFECMSVLFSLLFACEMLWICICMALHVVEWSC